MDSSQILFGAIGGIIFMKAIEYIGNLFKKKDDDIIENKDETNIENKDNETVENKDETNIENKEDEIIENKEETNIENKDNETVENKDETNIENKDNETVENKDDINIETCTICKDKLSIKRDLYKNKKEIKSLLGNISCLCGSGLINIKKLMDDITDRKDSKRDPTLQQIIEFGENYEWLFFPKQRRMQYDSENSGIIHRLKVENTPSDILLSYKLNNYVDKCNPNALVYNSLV